MLALKLPAEIEKRLTNLARKTHRTKSFYAREAILKYLEELEDTYIALQRLETPGTYLTTEELEKKLDLED